MTGLNPLELNPTTDIFVAFFLLTRSSLLCYGLSVSSCFLGVCCPSSLLMLSFPVNQRKIIAVSTAFLTWEAGTDGIFWKAVLSNLDFLDKEQGRAGHSHCPSGLCFSLWFIAPLGAHPLTQPLPLASACPRCHTCLLQPGPGFHEPIGIAAELGATFSLAGL